MGQQIEIIENSRVTIEGLDYKIKSCRACGCSTVYIQHRGGKYQMKCWWDTSCKNRSGWHDTLIDALKEWNDR